MKNLLLLLLLPIFIYSCKSTKNADCDAYGSKENLQLGNKYIKTSCEEFADCVICIDSVKCETLHVHLYHHETCEWSCLYMPSEEFVCIDTFYFNEDAFHTDLKYDYENN